MIVYIPWILNFLSQLFFPTIYTPFVFGIVAMYFAEKARKENKSKGNVLIAVSIIISLGVSILLQMLFWEILLIHLWGWVIRGDQLGIVTVPGELFFVSPFIALTICYYINEKFWKKKDVIEKFVFYFLFSLIIIIVFNTFVLLFLSYPSPLNPLPYPLNRLLVEHAPRISLILIGLSIGSILLIRMKFKDKKFEER